MNLLIKSAKIIDPNSMYHNEICDVRIKNGKIDMIKNKITLSKSKEIEYKADNLHLSPGWFYLHANFGEPGYEQNETFETGCNAAIKGGYTGVMVMPNNKPAIDNKGMIEYIIHATKNKIIDIIPSGNITKNGNGDELVEMHDMEKAGCKAFTDDKKSISRNEVMKIAMLYSKDGNALIMHYPNEKSIANV